MKEPDAPISLAAACLLPHLPLVPKTCNAPVLVPPAPGTVNLS